MGQTCILITVLYHNALLLSDCVLSDTLFVIQLVVGNRTSGVTVGDSGCGVGCGRVVRAASTRNSASSLATNCGRGRGIW